MALLLSTPADLVNNALVQIGYKKLIGSVNDGSAAANLSLAIYGQTRDELLRSQDWGFASRDIVLTLLKQAPAGGYFPPTVWSTAYPPIPYMFEYAYPGDCLKVRSIKPQTLFVPNFDPAPNPFRISNDNAFSPPQKVILSYVPMSLMTYTAQVTDPQTWEVSFAEALSDMLGEKLAAGLANMDAAKLEAAKGAQDNNTATMEQG